MNRMAANLNVPRLKSRAPVYNEQGEMYFFNAPFKNLRGFYEYFSSRLLKDEQLSDAQDGIYTWVMIQPGSVYAIRTRSSQEIGSLHHNIMSYIRYREHMEPVLLASGELQITTDATTGVKTVVYNFQSSLFCQQVLLVETKKRKQKANAFQCELAAEVISTRFHELFPGAVIEFKINHDLIEDVRILTAPNMMEVYHRFLTRKNVSNKQRARAPPRTYLNRPNRVSNRVPNRVPNQVPNVLTNALTNQSNNKKNNTKRRKQYTITHVQPFQPSESLTGFHVGVKHNKSKKNVSNSRR